MMKDGFKTTFDDCYSLCELPWFELDDSGRLKTTPEARLKIIDFHTHIGLSQFFRGKIDMWKETPEVLHYFPARGNPIDLNTYTFKNLTDDNRKKMKKHLTTAVFVGSDRARTHTIPNFLREMDALGVEKSVVLAIEVRFLFRNTAVILENLKDHPRLIPFCCIHPAHGRIQEKLEKHIAAGAKGLKFHPVFQTIAPDAPGALKLFSLCARYNLPILTHTSASGEEPAFMQSFARLERFREAIKAAQGTPFILGHSGMTDGCRQAIQYAVEFDNVYLELSGQPVCRLREIFEKVDHSRLLFGSDWPFYHAAFPLASVLIATEGDETLRRMALYENAASLLRL
ncbi:MAG: amidohydrolase family protein [bacterium]